MGETIIEYALYVESGPKHRTTMVHVPELLGCIAQGATTELALDATPEAIRTFLRFLKRHGEYTKTDAPISVSIVEHVMEGSRLGYGDPTPGFKWDFHELSAEGLSTYLRHLAWLREDVIKLIDGLSSEQLTARPEGSGRAILEILHHMAESQGVYLRYLVGKVDGLSEANADIRHGTGDLVLALKRLWQITELGLSKLTDEERKQSVQHGQVTWTARRALRRMLEHDWEHFVEMSVRLGVGV